MTEYTPEVVLLRSTGLDMASPYNYVVTSQAPTAVSHAAVGSFFVSSTDKALAIAKVNRLELQRVTPEGLVPMFDLPVYGRIASLQFMRLPVSVVHLDGFTVTAAGARALLAPSIPHQGQLAAFVQADTRDTLVFTTERYQFVAVQYDDITHQLKTIASGDLRDRLGKPIDRGQIVTIDPFGRAIAFQFYDGLVKVMRPAGFACPVCNCTAPRLLCASTSKQR